MNFVISGRVNSSGGMAIRTGPKASGKAPEIGVGMLGYAFMGKAHSNAFKKIPYMVYPPTAIPRLVALCGRDEQAVSELLRASTRYAGHEPVGIGHAFGIFRSFSSARTTAFRPSKGSAASSPHPLCLPRG